MPQSRDGNTFVKKSSDVVNSPSPNFQNSGGGLFPAFCDMWPMLVCNMDHREHHPDYAFRSLVDSLQTSR